MSKIFLIARREYLAFVRTFGFWLSLVVLPVLIVVMGMVPILLESSTPVKQVNVAVLDLSGQGVDSALRAMVGSDNHVTKGAVPEALRNMSGHADIRLVPTPPAMAAITSADEAERKMPGLLDTTTSAVIVARDSDGVLAFDLWSVDGQKDILLEAFKGPLSDLQAYHVAETLGVDPQAARDIRNAQARITPLTPAIIASRGQNPLIANVRDFGPKVVGAAMGYLSWVAIFSSSMILLGGVIEEKASKVLEVLLASAPSESLLIGKVLGVAAVMLTVALFWIGTVVLVGSYAMSAIPEGNLSIVQQLQGEVAALFTPMRVGLMLMYFVGGYLMFGVTFAAIGAFCETQKDAQAIMGPVMIVLMIPMLSLQAVFLAPDSPVLAWLSWVPIFSPFLMPVRLAREVPWYEIAGTLAAMAVVGFFMIALGRRAFRQGALAGGKLDWGRVLRIATRKVEA